MSFFEALGAALWAWRGTLSAARRLQTWSPLVAFALLRVLAALVLAYFHRPGVVAFAEPWVRWVGGESATHFPVHMYALPDLLRSVDALLLPIVGTVAWGASARHLAHEFRRPNGAKTAPGLSVRPLVGIGIVLVAAEWIVLESFALVPDQVRAISTIVRLALLFAQWSLISMAYYFAAYFVPAVVLESGTWRTAARKSLRVRRDLPLLTLLLVLLPMGIRFPFFVSGHIDLDDKGMPPEGMLLLVGIQIVVETVLTYTWLGSVTRVFLWRSTQEEHQ